MQISQGATHKGAFPFTILLDFIPSNIKTWKDQRGICSKHAIFSPQLSAPCHSEHRGRATAQHLGFSCQEDPDNYTYKTCLDQICNQLDPRFLWEKTLSKSRASVPLQNSSSEICSILFSKSSQVAPDQWAIEHRARDRLPILQQLQITSNNFERL